MRMDETIATVEDAAKAVVEDIVMARLVARLEVDVAAVEDVDEQTDATGKVW